MFSEGATDAIKRHRVDAAVHEGETESHDAENMPECVVIFLSCWAEIENIIEKCSIREKICVSALVKSNLYAPKKNYKSKSTEVTHANRNPIEYSNYGN